MDEWDCVKRVMEARYESTKPDDQVAKQQQLGSAKSTAQAHYHVEQNALFVHNVNNR